MPRKKTKSSGSEGGNGKLLDAAVELVLAGGGQDPSSASVLSKYPRFGSLIAFTQGELDQLASLRDLLIRYVGLRSAAHPLCVAVFGSPGSGKSFSVKQIRSEVERALRESGMPNVRLPFTTINLTQVSHSTEVGRVVARIAGETDDSTVPIVFFDEFDAARGSTPYGWLSWFLAPMHDGEFLHEGAVIRLRRAIYVFAGGTASTMEEFSSLVGTDPFRAAKGPDFISRLRGFLDVQGPNADPRALRRAVLLGNEIESQSGRSGRPRIQPDADLVRSLLSVGRLKHGARSFAALVEMSDFTAEDGRLSWQHLPEDHLLAMHVDRGPLDARLVGGSIALSGYQPNHDRLETTSDGLPAYIPQDALVNCWLAVASSLWTEGATLAYAGNWQMDYSGQLMGHLVDALKKLPSDPSRSKERRDKPYPRLQSFQQAAGKVRGPRPSLGRLGLEVVVADHVNERERSGLQGWQARVVERFRQRLAVVEASVARFAVGGALSGHHGRMPGIAEELMLSLAAGHPVYISGAFEGASLDIGSLLGLAHPRTGETPPSLQSSKTEEVEMLDAIADKLRPSPWQSLPVHPLDAVAFFRDHALGSANWPDNGLSAQQNRQLFAATDPAEIASLVRKGLLRVFE